MHALLILGTVKQQAEPLEHGALNNVFVGLGTYTRHPESRMHWASCLVLLFLTNKDFHLELPV